MPNTERTYYVICDDNCKFESMTKEQIYDAIAEATGMTPTPVDDAFITMIKEQNSNKNMKFWHGTEAQYNALQETDANTIYVIGTNEVRDFEGQIETVQTNVQELQSTVEELQEDIEAGTWIPTVTGVNATDQKGFYIKVGKMVVVSFYVQGTSLLSQNIYIKGASLPFAPSTSAVNYSGGGAMSGGYFPANSVFVGYRMVASNGNIIPVKHNGVNTDGKRALSVISSRGDETETVQMTGTLMYMTD